MGPESNDPFTTAARTPKDCDFLYHSVGAYFYMLNINTVCSLMWPEAIFAQWNKRRNLHKNRVQSQKEYFTPPTWPPFLCLLVQDGRRDVMWTHSIWVHGYLDIISYFDRVCLGTNIVSKMHFRHKCDIFSLHGHFYSSKILCTHSYKSSWLLCVPSAEQTGHRSSIERWCSSDLVTSTLASVQLDLTTVL